MCDRANSVTDCSSVCCANFETYDWLKLLLSANHTAADGYSKSKMVTSDENFTAWMKKSILLLLFM